MTPVAFRGNVGGPGECANTPGPRPPLKQAGVTMTKRTQGARGVQQRLHIWRRRQILRLWIIAERQAWRNIEWRIRRAYDALVEAEDRLR